MFAELGEALHVALAGLDFFVEDDAVEALLAFVELVGEVEVGIGDEAEEVEVFGDLDFGVFDAFGDFDFLFAGEQWDLAHLLEVHADWVVEDVEFLVGLGFLVIDIGFVALFVFVAIDLGGVDNVELHVAEALHDGLDVIGIDEVVGEDFVDVVVGEVVLLFGELDEFADLFLDFRGVDAAFVGVNLCGF